MNKTKTNPSIVPASPRLHLTTTIVRNLSVRTGVRAGNTSRNHNSPRLVVRSHVKAGSR